MYPPTIPLCFWCHSELPKQYIDIFNNPTVALPGCVHCVPAARELSLQCAWCGLMVTGSDAGKIMLKPHETTGNLVPDLSKGESHSCCASCLLLHFPKQALRIGSAELAKAS